MLLSQQGISLIIWMVVFTLIITTVVAFRFWAIQIKKRSLRPDDYMIIIAYISTLALEGCTWWGIANGLGAHTAKLNEYELGVQFKILLGTGFTWLFATVFCKLSILWFLTCIFTTKRFKICAWILMGVVVGYGISFLCAFFTNCQPLSYSWDPVPGGYCKSVTVEEITSVSVNMVIDTAIVILPMPPLWGLQMPVRKKVAISGIFSLGLLVVAIMGWRIQITVQATTETDFAYGLGLIGLVTHLEVWLGIIVACLPTLAPLFSKYLGPVVSRLPKSSGRRSGPRLKEAQNTIGGGSAHSQTFSKRNFSRLTEGSLLEMEEGKSYSKAEVMAGSITEEEEPWMSDPRAIGVRHDVRVYDEPQKQEIV